MRIKLVPNLKTCFVSVPAALADELRKGAPTGAVILQLSWEEPEGECRACVSWNGAKTSGSQPVLEMGEAFGQCLGLASALANSPSLPVRVVRVELVEYPSRIELEPCTSDDWELMELHAGYLEDELLRQICVVFAGETIPLWVHGNKLIRFRVINLSSRAPQRLGARTEVAVAPRPRMRVPPNEAVDEVTTEIYQASPPLRVQPRREGGQGTVDSIPSTGILLHSATYQAIQHGNHHGGGGETGRGGGSGERMIGGGGGGSHIGNVLAEGKLASIWLEPPPERGDETRQSSSLPMAVGIIILSDQVLPGHLMLPKSLRLQIGVRCFDCIRLRILSTYQWPTRANSITLHPIRWMTPEGRNNAVGSRDESPESQAFLEGGFAGREIRQSQQQAVSGEEVWSGLGEWIKEEARRVGERSSSTTNGHTEIFLADGAILLLSMGPKKIKKAFALSMESAFPVIPSPFYIALNGPHESLLIGTETPRAWLSDQTVEPPGPLGGRENQLEACLRHLAPLLLRPTATARIRAGLPLPGGLLIHGQSCSGKTALCRALASLVKSRTDMLATTVWIDCKSLRGHKMSLVLAALTEAMSKARYGAPALLVLDDLDALTPAESEDAGEANLQAAEISDLLMELWREQSAWVRAAEEALSLSLRAIDEQDGGDDGGGGRLAEVGGIKGLSEAAAVAGTVAIVATARDPNLIHLTLRRPGGFEGHVEVPSLDAKAREAVLAALLDRHSSSSHNGRRFDLAGIAARLEGCTPADMELVVTRALHAAVGRSLLSSSSSQDSHYFLQKEEDERPHVTLQNLEGALEGFTPASLRGARLFASETTWDDVGGLWAAKLEVRDVLEVPVRFAPLYARLPTRLPTGLLLYGPPGCGKTLLAGAIAKECGLNFISVKGPEVLDKYIGASEQAVRTLFARATAAAPCILFFDEFEALAPRRGNDNTGVTDRVVNQLLTFLDGVEGRSGVYVMGATSRPDMIDPALLRPGRLDRQLYLGFPDGTERAQILLALSRRMNLTEDATTALHDVSVAEGSELLTGADLQALLSTAQLNAVHERLAEAASASTAATAASSSSSASQEDDDKTPLKNKDDTISTTPSASTAPVQITARHVWEAFETTRPSMPLQDRIQFQAIYDRFGNARKADFKAASATDDGTLRTALR